MMKRMILAVVMAVSLAGGARAGDLSIQDSLKGIVTSLGVDPTGLSVQQFLAACQNIQLVKVPAAVTFASIPFTRRYSADAITGHADGDVITSWPDSSSNNVAATSTAGPVYKTGILNSKPVLRFDGTKFITATTGGVNFQGPSYWAALVKWSTIGNNYQHLLSLSDATDNKRVSLLKFTDDTITLNGDEVTNVPIVKATTTGWHLYEVAYDGSTFNVAVDGTVVSSSQLSVTSRVSTAINLAANNATNTDNLCFTGDAAEFYFMNAVPSAVQAQAIRTYLGSKYALTLQSAAPLVNSASVSTVLSADGTKIWTSGPVNVGSAQNIKTGLTNAPFTGSTALSVTGAFAVDAGGGASMIKNGAAANTFSVWNYNASGFSAANFLDTLGIEAAAFGFAQYSQPWSADGTGSTYIECSNFANVGGAGAPGQFVLVQTGNSLPAKIRLWVTRAGDFIFYDQNSTEIMRIYVGGGFHLSERVAPGKPADGTTIYVDSTTHNLMAKFGTGAGTAVQIGAHP